MYENEAASDGPAFYRATDALCSAHAHAKNSLRNMPLPSVGKFGSQERR